MNHLQQNSQKSIKKAVFLDRDGTLNIDYGYVYQPEKIHLIDGAIEAIDIFLQQGYLLFLFTNQPGIERKLYALHDVEACHKRLFELLGKNCFTEICIAQEAIHSPDAYRKPSPRFIQEMIQKYDLSTAHSYMIGDKETDAFAGIGAYIRSILLDSNYPRSERCIEGIHSGAITPFRDLISFARSLLL